jgi:hypothetical protein
VSPAASSTSSPVAEREEVAAPPPPVPSHRMQTRAQHGIFKPNPKYAEDLEFSELCLSAAEEPESVEEALADDSWRKAMEEEMNSIVENDTWDLADLPAGQKAIGLKWVFKVKKDPQGKVLRHKARLVAKGYAQKQGIDFDEVFAPVARMDTVRLLLALAAHQHWQVHHMDVKSAFLNGELVEQVYVQQPTGFVDKGSQHKVLRLRKALYGLRQAPRAWNSKLDASLTSLGFEKCPLEHALYRKGDSNTFLLVGVYVDDLIITGTSTEDIAEFKSQMHELFKMSDLGLLSYYLGIEVKQAGGEITLCQSSYAARILDSAGMASCNPCHTPIEMKLKLGMLKEGDPVNPTQYRSIIGSLRYLVNTRPDIAYAVGIASRYMECPGSQHWAVVKQILRYVRGTQNYGFSYTDGMQLPVVTGYSDSDWAGDVDDRKSTSGMVFFLDKNIITWTSQKQKVVALSSCEAEYIAASTAACQAVWLSKMLSEIQGCQPSAVKHFIDNQSAIALSKNPVFHERTKHIDTRFHFIRECVTEGKIKVEHIGTEGQLADILTKALGRVKFIELRRRLGVIDVKLAKQD